MASAQTAEVQEYDLDLSKNKYIKNVLSNKAYRATVHPELESEGPVATSFYQDRGTRATTGTVMGSSTYDLMTNSTTKQRLYVRSDGTISAVWTGSDDAAGGWPDRGTFYNYYDGSAWGTPPDTRIEGSRTGWPVIVNSGAKELLYSHDFGDPLGVTLVNERTPGSGAWGAGTAATVEGIWPNVAHEEGSNYVHLTVSNYLGANGNNYTLYYRSSDGGASWDITKLRLPGIDTASGYNVMGADVTNIAVQGSKVAIVSANSGNDLAVWTSNSNGDVGTWTRTRILEFPFANFDGNVVTDIDGDGVGDQVETTDGSHAVIMDNTGRVHVMSGAMLIIDETPGDDAWSFFPGVSGVWYWNEDMGADSVQLLDPLVDWDLSGDPLDGIGADVPNYGVGSTSNLAMTLDPTSGRVYALMTMMVEGTDFLGDPTDPSAQSFRDIFGIYTDDAGATWSSPAVNLTLDAGEELENQYPMVYPVTVGDKVHVMYMRDSEPGHSVSGDTDPIFDNMMVYMDFPFSAFEPAAATPTAIFSSIESGLTATFNNQSENAVQYLWDFGDGSALNIAENPIHSFPSSGTYTVCMEATNVYGTDEACEDVTVMSIGIQDVALENALTVGPNPTAGTVILNADGLTDLTAIVYDMTGRMVVQPSPFTSGRLELNLGHLANGHYMVQVHSADGFVTRNLQVNH